MATTPIEGFIEWLPGELEYSARKAGYDKKIKRAYLPVDDRSSIHGFLGAEWDNHQLLKRQGAHYKPFHGMSAQLQLSKFAAGLFDKAAIGRWLASDTAPTQENFISAARDTADMAIEVLPTQIDPEAHPYDVVRETFESTPFSQGIKAIMRKIRETDGASGESRTLGAYDLMGLATHLGGLATNCYLVYAAENLATEQFMLPASQLTGES